MKLECLKDRLLEALVKVEKIASSSKNQNLPILSCVCIQTRKGEILIKSTNLDVGIEVTVPAKIIDEGVVVVSGSILLSFVSQIKNEKNISLDYKDGGLHITSGKMASVIKTQANIDDFPTIPRVDSESSFTINPSVFSKGLKSVFYAASVSQVKQELTSVYLYSDDESLIFVSTDSFRLAEKTIKQKNAFDVPPTIIPAKNIGDIVRVLDGLNEDIEINFSKTQISISSNNIFFVSRLVEGSFPDYRQIIPKSFATEAIVLTKDLHDCLKTSNIFSDKFNQIKMLVKTKEKSIKIESKNSSVGEYNASIDTNISGEPLDVFFNSKYIIDCFQSIDSDSISLSFAGVNKPLVIKGISDKSFMYLVMPMNK